MNTNEIETKFTTASSLSGVLHPERGNQRNRIEINNRKSGI